MAAAVLTGCLKMERGSPEAGGVDGSPGAGPVAGALHESNTVKLLRRNYPKPKSVRNSSEVSVTGRQAVRLLSLEMR